MRIDLRGRVRNIKLTQQHGLHPLFEAVVNAMHGIQERGSGVIDVYVRRDHTQGLLNPEDIGAQPITGFEVHDTGIGFTDTNFRSFDTSDSMHKANQGGKGIGRFLWLKAFAQAEVKSTFCHQGSWQERTFRFTLDGVTDPNLSAAATADPRTIIRLIGFRTEYRDKAPKTLATIANRIIEHCLGSFVLGSMPPITLHEDRDHELIDLHHLFKTEVQPQSKTEDLTLKGQTFRITHLLVGTRYENQHSLHYCADQRAVTREQLAKRLPDLPSALREANSSYVYAGYVSGSFLDEHVAQERTGFDGIPAGEDVREEDLTWRDITDAAVESAASFLNPFTAPIREAKEEQVKEFVRSKAPQYRTLIKHRPQVINHIPPNLSPDKLDAELYKHDLSYKAELKAKAQELLASPPTDHQDIARFDRKLEQFLEEWNEAGMAELARYVAHRKAILSFLEANIGLQGDGKYALERALHNVIFPLKTTSDEVPAERMNLWVLDERLAYHHYLASDITLKKMAGTLQNESKDRPDLIIFQGPSAFVESNPPFHAITIIEFKRPVRDDYTAEENPITQIYGYIETIRAGKALDRKGRPVNIPQGTPFFAYIICDITPSLIMQAKSAGLRETADARGFFGYNDPFGVYVDIVSFDKLIDDAKRRNAILFDKLGVGTQ